ncbi:MAG: Tll0287-like domain-containing protein [Aurantibacter sp.]
MKYSILLSLILILVSCKNGQKSGMEPIDGTSATKEAQTAKTHPGEKILEQECYMCHNPKSTKTSMIAPPMIAIKRHYIDSTTTKEEFTEALIRWITDPETESKMPGAHKKFGVMPYLPYPEDAVAQIAEYIYDYQIEQPDWFDAHFQKAHKKGKGMGECKCMEFQDAEVDYADIGLGYASVAQTQLGKNLMKAIQDKGTVGAIEFCKLKARKLTDSISMMKNAVIKRVSDKPRNRANQANAEELGYIESFKKKVPSDGEVQPIVNIENGEVNFYYPISTNAMCLQCHGMPSEQIVPETLASLKSLYPSDQAVGYDINEVRGIWVINFDEESID